MKMTDLQKSIVETVKVEGIAKSHIKDLFNQEGIDLFNEVIEFYQGYFTYVFTF